MSLPSPFIRYINLFFGALTYFVKPYTEDLDRWLDFFARNLLNFFCLVLPYYHASVPQGTNDAVTAQMYSPFASLSYLTGQGGNLSTTAALADATLTAYAYIFTLYVLDTIGVFRSMQRQFRATIFAYHDHILNYLLDKLETRNIGFENIFEGLHLVQVRPRCSCCYCYHCYCYCYCYCCDRLCPVLSCAHCPLPSLSHLSLNHHHHHSNGMILSSNKGATGFFPTLT